MTQCTYLILESAKGSAIIQAFSELKVSVKVAYWFPGSALSILRATFNVYLYFNVQLIEPILRSTLIASYKSEMKATHFIHSC